MYRGALAGFSDIFLPCIKYLRRTAISLGLLFFHQTIAYLYVWTNWNKYVENLINESIFFNCALFLIHNLHTSTLKCTERSALLESAFKLMEVKKRLYCHYLFFFIYPKKSYFFAQV